MTYNAGNAYLRHKRANMRKEYLQMMEEIARVESPVKPSVGEAPAETKEAEPSKARRQPEAVTEELEQTDGVTAVPQSDDSSDKDI